MNKPRLYSNKSDPQDRITKFNTLVNDRYMNVGLKKRKVNTYRIKRHIFF